MGKSPGRWIKTVLFGKKHSKSYLSKNVTPDKKASTKAAVEDVARNSQVISADKGAEDMELEKGTSGSPSGTIASFPGNQSLDLQSNFVSVPVSDAEMRIQDQAATKAQAVFRGFLARRAFWALKGIIRLQAVIRGHLVRRQAVATLRCMQAIVRFQAVARGRRIRLSDTRAEVRKMYNMGELQVDIGANSMFGSEKLATNAYVRKLLLPLPTPMSLRLQYDPAEPNSALNWLERWSLSQFWKPPARPRKVLNKMPQRKQGDPQIVENEAGKSRRSIRKASTAANGDNGALASFEMDKPKRNSRKVTSHQTENQPQNELERVKCNLGKVSASTAVSTEKSETETEKPLQQLSVRTVLNNARSDVSEQELVISAENPDGLIDKLASLEAPSRTMSIDEPYNDHPPKMETTFFQEKLNSKEKQKIRKRRSLPAKQEYPENISLNTPCLPSYMAATESLMAKLRAQGSSKLSEDGEESGFVRRHSLPASSNDKLSSLLPRIQKPVHTNGKGSNKTNRSMMSSSRDDKVLQPGWRR